MFFFSLLGLQVKLLLAKVNIETIVFYRSLIGLIIILIFSIILKRGIKIVKTSNIKIHIVDLYLEHWQCTLGIDL